MTGGGGHFISYSGADGADIALRLAEGLEGGTPPVPVWFDKFEKQRHRLRPGEFWPQQLTEGLRACEGLIFVVTPDSVGEGSNCLPELYRADSYRKPLIPVRARRRSPCRGAAAARGPRAESRSTGISTRG